MRTLTADYRDDRDALVARSKVVAASPQLRAYKAEHQHGWEAEVVDVLERRALAQHAPVPRDELQLVTRAAATMMPTTPFLTPNAESLVRVFLTAESNGNTVSYLRRATLRGRSSPLARTRLM